MHDLVAGHYRLPWEDAVKVVDGNSRGFPAPTRTYTPSQPAARAQLSNAEIRVVRLAACGLSYKEVARRLGKSPNTVDNQLRSARAKLNVRNQVELAQACLKWL
jgi:DNA-binding CsgD family transcriptional regulator